MNHLAMQIIDDDGEPVREDEKCWHYVDVFQGDGEAKLLCSGEHIHDESASGNGEEYLIRHRKRGGVTCKKCIETIIVFKAIKL